MDELFTPKGRFSLGLLQTNREERKTTHTGTVFVRLVFAHTYFEVHICTDGGCDQPSK